MIKIPQKDFLSPPPNQPYKPKLTTTTQLKYTLAVSELHRRHCTPPYPDLWRLFPLHQYPCRSFPSCSIQIWCCSMIPVPLHPDMYLSLIPVISLWRSVLLRTTLQCLSLLHVTHADLRLSGSLLQDLGSVSLCDTNICPNKTEEYSIPKPRMNISEVKIYYKSYLCTPLPTISDTSITAPKLWYRLIKTTR